MKVFMLGWEFPPHISGGLGTACFGLTKALDGKGVEISFVLPQPVGPGASPSHVEFRSPTSLSATPTPTPAPDADAQANMPGQLPSEIRDQFGHMKYFPLTTPDSGYATAEGYHEMVQELLSEAARTGISDMDELMRLVAERKPDAGRSDGFFVGMGENYDGDLMDKVYRYSRLAVELARREDFDVVHAHDWMTYPAGQAVAAVTGKPLVVHVHSTEFDRSGENVNQRVYDIERSGMHAASKVVCVSYLTQNIVMARYGVPAAKTAVVYNATEADDADTEALRPIRQNEKIVLFLGRVTMQKGPEYFLMAARKVVDKFPNVRFVMAGSGDMATQCIRLCADLRLGGHVTFTGFLRGDDVRKIFSMADLYVMPSVSEPFGIAPLEALSHNVPVIISKQSGVSEVLTHVLKVDFWDIDEMANKILAVLRHPPLQRTLRQHGQFELRKLNWSDAAEKVNEVYKDVISAQVT
jgi:glycosyltransferase involved in cell wall biosynthesis